MGELSLSTTRKELFGSLDALDEKDNIFKQYFVETNIFHKMSGNENFLILIGEKGTGKSAIIKMCMITDKENNKLVVDIQRPQVNEALTINEKINAWKNYLADRIIDVINKMRIDSNNLGKMFSVLEDALNDFTKNKYNINYKKVKNQILDTLSPNLEIRVYIDDLDTGYRGTREQNESIISLFTAIREIMRENDNLRFRVTLRSDVYDNIRKVDESADKIQDVKLTLKITNHQILAMLTKRVMNFIDASVAQQDFYQCTQQRMMQYMSKLFETTFHGRGKWKNKATNYILMTMTRRRPRDLFVLCGLAWENAISNNRIKITSEDLQAIFNDYSNERLRDAISEYHHEFRNEEDLKELILALKPSKQQMKKKDVIPLHLYTKETLLRKVHTITERRNFYWSNGKVSTDLELAKFLYKANIVVGRKDEDGIINRIYYTESPNLLSDLGNGNYKFEVHPAYRWAIDFMNDYILNYVDSEEDNRD